jgi:hypothetical protein
MGSYRSGAKYLYLLGLWIILLHRYREISTPEAGSWAENNTLKPQKSIAEHDYR